MSDAVFDFSEFTALEADISKIPGVLPGPAIKALQGTAFRVKNDWRDPIRGSLYFAGAAPEITYDVYVDSAAGEFKAEIGEEPHDTAGSLLGISEYGSPTSGPQGFGSAALQKNEDDFERGVDAAVTDSLKAINL